jgi:deoxyadenosine/deoxycytidine kinase
MIFIITGRQASGKTTLLDYLTDHFQVSYIYDEMIKDRFSRFLFNNIEDYTKFIVFQDTKKIHKILKMISGNEITIEKQCQSPRKIKTPDIIIVCDYRFDIKELDKIKTPFTHINCDLRNKL